MHRLSLFDRVGVRRFLRTPLSNKPLLAASYREVSTTNQGSCPITSQTATLPPRVPPHGESSPLIAVFVALCSRGTADQHVAGLRARVEITLKLDRVPGDLESEQNIVSRQELFSGRGR